MGRLSGPGEIRGKSDWSRAKIEYVLSLLRDVLEEDVPTGD